MAGYTILQLNRNSSEKSRYNCHNPAKPELPEGYELLRNKDYAKRLLKHLCGNYKQKYDKILVGTTENNISFYVKQEFNKYEKT